MSSHQGKDVAPRANEQDQKQPLGRRKSSRSALSKKSAAFMSPERELASSSGPWLVVQNRPSAAAAATVARPLTKSQTAIWFLSFLSSLGTSSIATRMLVGNTNSTRVKRSKRNKKDHHHHSSNQELVTVSSTSSSSMVHLWYQLFSMFSSSKPRPTSMSFTDTIPLVPATSSSGCSSNNADRSTSSSSSTQSFIWGANRRRQGSIQPWAFTVAMLLWIVCVTPFSASAYVVDRGLTQAQDGTRGPSSAAAAALSTSCNHNVQSSHGHGLVKRQESLEPVSFGAVSFEARPLSMFTAFAALDEKNLTCNGRADLCDLRYNQVTYAGTHNSAAYDLKYDCDTAVESCLKSTTYCVQQQQNCTKGWETRCTKMSNSCIDRLPKWLHWLCGAFSSVCESTEQFCLGWEQICTSSVQVCTLWGSACLDVVPQWLLPCLWENQPGHPIAQQLADGIRFLDLGTCLTVDNSSVVMCHGFGPQRAVGVSLDSVLSAILDFYLKNPTEIITIEFNEADGDAADMAIMSKIIVQKMLQYFTLPNGHQLLWSRNSSSEPWPTLREMVTKNQRIVVFMGSVYDPIPEPKPRWANQKDVWKHDGFRYTYDDTTPAELNASYYKWCDQGPKNDGSFIQWQQIDINMAIIVDDLWDEIKAGRMPQVCIEPLAIQTNSAFLEALANYCYDKWPYWFRVRVNNYWHGSVFKVTDQFNDRNVARVKAGDSITPY